MSSAWTAEVRLSPTLRTTVMLWTVAAFASGLLAGVLWYESHGAWKRHLAGAFATGFRLFAALQDGQSSVDGITIKALGPADAAIADKGNFASVSGVPQPSLVTVVTIREPVPVDVSRRIMSLAIISPEIRYPVADLEVRENLPPAEKLAVITKLLATYCSDSLVLAKNAQGNWFRLQGGAVWSCAAAPRDFRLVAAFIAVLSLAAILTSVADTSQKFRSFAEALRSRRRVGGPDSYVEHGPAELREIVSAVNSYMEKERAHLFKRAEVLSGVSHDLGAPATRLRLRAALIVDGELRRRLDADIDQMIGMIESVLAFTRSELSDEEPRRLSLTALIEALVADYQDLDRPVELETHQPEVIETAASVFMSSKGHRTLPDERRLLVIARPMSLQRAIVNLVENALKYGRRATVRLNATSAMATIEVEDEGGRVCLGDIEKLVAPFQRGRNSVMTEGFGLGLTIASTIAEQHGGGLQFEQGDKGLRVKLTIQRG
ncbi:HAMP domain-containing sensor histidine kinase [Mesorhizobium sp. YR577]|uniref:sensor histidine kinase n=1 Tax=Mesorhizobium sp. YR577 TaxID=1884373 RepID=UPI000B88DDE6|nr:HAMP domain-containing sensor histidine kinase [Mesorhizobium sp. YR577]